LVSCTSAGKRAARLLLAAAALLVTTTAAIGQANCPGQGDCFVANGTPGCNNASCCQIVCPLDPFCCTTEWDSLCVSGAQNVAACGCPSCVGDLNGDGVVDGADLGILLNAWGPCPGCPADLDGNGVVDGADLGILLNAWGPCP